MLAGMTYRYLRDLDKAAAASGLKIVTISGWKLRGRPFWTGQFNPKGIIAHHTGDLNNGFNVANGILRNGRSGLPGPLSQISLDRQGVVYIIAAGRANHAGKTRSLSNWIYAGDGNAQTIGIEAQNSGSEGWNAVQLDAYHRLCASLADWYNWPRSRVAGHGETSTAGKWDPGVRPGVMMNMNSFRAAVAAVRLKGAVVKPVATPIVKKVARYEVTSTALYGYEALTAKKTVNETLKRGDVFTSMAYRTVGGDLWVQRNNGNWFDGKHLDLVKVVAKPVATPFVKKVARYEVTSKALYGYEALTAKKTVNETLKRGDVFTSMGYRTVGGDLWVQRNNGNWFDGKHLDLFVKPVATPIVNNIACYRVTSAALYGYEALTAKKVVNETLHKGDVFCSQAYRTVGGDLWVQRSNGNWFDGRHLDLVV